MADRLYYEKQRKMGYFCIVLKVIDKVSVFSLYFSLFLTILVLEAISNLDSSAIHFAHLLISSVRNIIFYFSPLNLQYGRGCLSRKITYDWMVSSVLTLLHYSVAFCHIYAMLRQSPLDFLTHTHKKKNAERLKDECVVTTVKHCACFLRCWSVLAGKEMTGDLIKDKGIMGKEQYHSVLQNHATLF